ncbi:cytochrome P450 [Fusarium proliferatum]|nr:cytochrome P450 [Fusarium proliferatum]
MGQVIIILNDAAVANEVMEKHSMDTASRPLSVVLGDLTGWDRQVSFQPNIDIVRVERKSILQALGSPKHIETYADQLNFEGKLFLLRLLEDPKRFVSHIRRQTGATILKIAYGYRVEPRGPDTLLDLSDLSAQQVIPAASPGAWAMDTLPVLKYLPSCFPGAHVKRLAYVWKQTLDDLSEKPYRFVLRQIDGGKHRGSYVSRHLDDLGHKPSPLEQRTIKWTAATMYAAGSDTTVITIHTFFLAMLQNPDVQHRAQMEIDKIVGRDRLPEPKDIENLPFVQALISEVLRWHPVAPTGIPHRATKDIACRDYIIPKGSILVPNIWAFTQDPTVYKDPLSFNPSRFLCEETDDGIPHKTPEPNPRQYVFGFGRRICPGRFLAEATFSLTIMQTLAAYKISKVVRDGKEVDIKADFLPGLLSHPVEFEAVIVPRHENVESIVRAVEADNPWASGDSKELEL